MAGTGWGSKIGASKWACNRPIQGRDGHSWTRRSGVRKSIPPCAISTFIVHGRGSSKRSISGPLPRLEGLPKGEPVGLLSRTVWAHRAANVPTSRCAEVLPWVGKNA